MQIAAGAGRVAIGVKICNAWNLVADNNLIPRSKYGIHEETEIGSSRTGESRYRK
jgi:predicted membrane protein